MSSWKEHDPVIEWLREKASSQKFRDKIETAKMDTAVEISSMICGIDGCNYTCRQPCEAIKFLILTFLSKETPQIQRDRIWEDAIGIFG